MIKIHHLRNYYKKDITRSFVHERNIQAIAVELFRVKGVGVMNGIPQLKDRCLNQSELTFKSHKVRTNHYGTETRVLSRKNIDTLPSNLKNTDRD